MNELIAFLRACLDDDDRVARAAADTVFGHPLDAPWEKAHIRFRGSEGTDADLAVARFANPARVLAEVEAKRRILGLHGESDACDAHDAAYATIPCDTLLVLAQPYAGRPGWRAEWAS